MKKPVQLDEKGHPKFGMIDKIAYAAGDFGCNMSFGLKGTVQTFWLTYMMLETGLLSILLLLVQIWDAVNDPIIGAVIDADTRRYKRGKFKSYILVGAIGLILGGAAVFLPFPQAAHDHQTENARAMQEAGGGILLPQKEAQAMAREGRLAPMLIELLNDRARLAAMRKGALTLARPEAADAVADELLKLANSD